MASITTASPSTARRTPGTATPEQERDEQGGRVQVWGHRGASAYLPENTLASYRAAILEGADGIESDVHLTTDNVILMFHDPTLDRTTDGKGKIKEQAWKEGIEFVRTKKEPRQPIPTFDQLIELMMEPENRHVVLNIDCKIQNDPASMFPLMQKTISSYPDYEHTLSPRLILGLWHPLFIAPAKQHLPTLRRYHIGVSTTIARKYFWDACEGFSFAFPMLMSGQGQAFLNDCMRHGKDVTVWTVNDKEEMITAAGWGVKAILTDKVAYCVNVRKEWEESPSVIGGSLYRKFLFPWSSWKYYTLTHVMFLRWVEDNLTKNAYLPGPLDNALLEPNDVEVQSVPTAIKV